MGLDSPIVHRIVKSAEFYLRRCDWCLKCRFAHASLHRTMAVIAMKRIVRATNRIGRVGFTPLSLASDGAL